MIAQLRALRPTVCRCGHDPGAHEHYRPGSDCGWCGDDVCPRYRRAWLRPRPQPADPDEVLADDQLLDAISRDVDRACAIAGPRLVGQVVAICAAEVTR